MFCSKIKDLSRFIADRDAVLCDSKNQQASPEPNLRFISCLSAYKVISLLERAHAILYFPGNHGYY
jgi:hypothetical protein